MREGSLVNLLCQKGKKLRGKDKRNTGIDSDTSATTKNYRARMRDGPEPEVNMIRRRQQKNSRGRMTEVAEKNLIRLQQENNTKG